MVKITPSSLCTKFQKSIDGWILPIPVKEDGQYKIRMFMHRSGRKNYDGEPILEFKDIYTYNVPSFEYLVKFFMFQSFGQAYHGFFRMIADRTDFQLEADHQQGLFLMEQVMKTTFLGESALICSQIQAEFDKIGFEFNIEPIKKSERKSVDEILIEVAKLI